MGICQHNLSPDSGPAVSVSTRKDIPLLLVEDDDGIADSICGSLSQRGYKVTHVADGAEGLTMAASGDFSVLIADRMLPSLDGLTLITTLRQRNIQLPALILSAISDCDNRVLGLGAGADDYLPKPFSLEELAARVGALLRRSLIVPEVRLVVGPLELDLINRLARRGDREIDLLPREFQLLEYLMRHRDQVATRGTCQRF